MSAMGARRGTRGTASRPGGSLPSGTVTFLFTDIEGSTRLARSLSATSWADLLDRHDRLADGIVGEHTGVVVKHEGDGTFAAFGAPADALAAAAEISAAVSGEAWPDGARIRLRMGLHTGEGRLTQDGADYVGIDVHYAARLTAAGNGGQVLVSDSTLGAVDGVVPAGATLVHEGRRRLKDFDEPRPVHRLVIPGAADDNRPLRTLAGTDMPEVLTSFVGRSAEVAEVASFVESARVVTLTGAGGSGKTRLALSVAAAVRSGYDDGVVFVDLAPVRDPAIVAGAIATAVGVSDVTDRPILDALLEVLAERRSLLVVDNVEQLLPSAATLIAEIVRRAPRVHLLVTSREALRIAGEQEYPVPPLDAPDAERLFTARAALVRPDFAPTEDDLAAIRAIAARVGGLPLAIELAAARVRLFSPTVILDRLGQSLDLLSAGSRDAPERHRTLRATIAWSHDLLSPVEQWMFRRLAVLVGEWTPETAAAIAAEATAPDPGFFDGLASLVDKGFLRSLATSSGDLRFGWHVFMREYATERLAESGERPGCARRHAETFRDLAVSFGPHLVEAGAKRYIEIIDSSIHDLRQAMTWSLETGDVEVGLRIIGSTWRWWQLRLNLREGRDWASRLLAHPEAAGDSIGRLEALAAAGGLAYWAMDYPATRALYVERLALAERIGDLRMLAEAHFDLSFVGMVERNLELLRTEAQAAVAGFESIGDRVGLVRARQTLVLGHYLAGDDEAARELEEANLAEFRASQSWYRLADSLMLLGAIHRHRGDPVAALASAREGLRTTPERIGGSTIGALGVIAVVEAESGDAEVGARLAGAIRAIRSVTGEALASVSVLHLPEPEDAVRARLGPELAERLMAEGESLAPEEAIRLALGTPGGGSDQGSRGAATAGSAGA